ncbi:cytochrome b5-like heme/steroid binding domain-containing protein [Fennellomyces sp. T-0311]|nr:cytochrome b5-like heme/steroid binding domain-containing protein [Fennellomyces sp. T-0311]
MSNVQRRKRPEQPEPSAAVKDNEAKKQVKSSSIVGTIATAIVWMVILFFGASYLITESWTWGYRGKWTNINTYIPRKELVFTEEQLLRYDGSNPNLPIYLAVDGDVYDVTKGAGWYGYGGSYHHFAGRDAARAYVTGCFQDHLTHDLRGLSEAQLKGIDGWKKFYENHHTYYKIGRVEHAAIDPSTPIPPPCKKSTPQKP